MKYWTYLAALSVQTFLSSETPVALLVGQDHQTQAGYAAYLTDSDALEPVQFSSDFKTLYCAAMGPYGRGFLGGQYISSAPQQIFLQASLPPRLKNTIFTRDLKVEFTVLRSILLDLV